MPRKQNAKVLARMDCPSPDCGQRVAVLQNVNGYLYTRCPVCLADQRRGPGVQAHIWRHMEPVEGSEIVRPPNLPDYCGDVGQPWKDRAEPIGTTAEAVPKVQDETSEEQAPETVPTGTGGGLWVLVGLVGLGVAAVAGAAR